MKKVLTIIAVAVISVLSFSSCQKDVVATKIVFSPSSVSLSVGEIQRIDFDVDGTKLPSGRTIFDVSFWGGDKTMIEVKGSGGNYVYLKGLKKGDTELKAVVYGDPKDENIRGTLKITITEF